MKGYLLTFEITTEGDAIEVHVDNDGISELIKILEKLQQGGGHEHLMSPVWGGEELGDQKQGHDNKLVHHVKIFKWD